MTNLKDIINTPKFKEKLKQAISSGIETDWTYDEDIDSEYEINTFDLDHALEQVLLLLSTLN